jgi:hypothetical protein
MKDKLTMAFFILMLIANAYIFVVFAGAWIKGEPYADDFPKEELIELELDEEIERAFDSCGHKVEWEKVYAERQERWDK